MFPFGTVQCGQRGCTVSPCYFIIIMMTRRNAPYYFHMGQLGTSHCASHFTLSLPTVIIRYRTSRSFRSLSSPPRLLVLDIACSLSLFLFPSELLAFNFTQYCVAHSVHWTYLGELLKFSHPLDFVELSCNAKRLASSSDLCPSERSSLSGRIFAVIFQPIWLCFGNSLSQSTLTLWVFIVAPLEYLSFLIFQPLCVFLVTLF